MDANRSGTGVAVGGVACAAVEELVGVVQWAAERRATRHAADLRAVRASAGARRGWIETTAVCVGLEFTLPDPVDPATTRNNQ